MVGLAITFVGITITILAIPIGLGLILGLTMGLLICAVGLILAWIELS